jgi:hypothetical protein
MGMLANSRCCLQIQQTSPQSNQRLASPPSNQAVRNLLTCLRFHFCPWINRRWIPPPLLALQVSRRLSRASVSSPPLNLLFDAPAHRRLNDFTMGPAFSAVIESAQAGGPGKHAVLMWAVAFGGFLVTLVICKSIWSNVLFASRERSRPDSEQSILNQADADGKTRAQSSYTSGAYSASLSRSNGGCTFK